LFELTNPETLFLEVCPAFGIPAKMTCKASLTREEIAVPRISIVFLQALPPLSDDAAGFSVDVRDVRRDFPVEADPWD